MIKELSVIDRDNLCNYLWNNKYEVYDGAGEPLGYNSTRDIKIDGEWIPFKLRITYKDNKVSSYITISYRKITYSYKSDMFDFDNRMSIDFIIMRLLLKWAKKYEGEGDK